MNYDPFVSKIVVGYLGGQLSWRKHNFLIFLYSGGVLTPRSRILCKQEEEQLTVVCLDAFVGSQSMPWPNFVRNRRQRALWASNVVCPKNVCSADSHKMNDTPIFRTMWKEKVAGR